MIASAARLKPPEQAKAGGPFELHGLRGSRSLGPTLEVMDAKPARLAYRVPAEAADALGVSPDFFDQHVRPELRLVHVGRLVFVSVAELRRWLENNSARAIASDKGEAA